MLSSTPSRKFKFLLDENVHAQLYRFLANSAIDVKLVPKSASDKQIEAISKKEHRILVTNDEDFVECTKGDLFALVWLRLPQNDPKTLIVTFEKLTKDLGDFAGKLIILRSGAWDELPLGERLDF